MSNHLLFLAMAKDDKAKAKTPPASAGRTSARNYEVTARVVRLGEFSILQNWNRGVLDPTIFPLTTDSQPPIVLHPGDEYYYDVRISSVKKRMVELSKTTSKTLEPLYEEKARIEKEVLNDLQCLDGEEDGFYSEAARRLQTMMDSEGNGKIDEMDLKFVRTELDIFDDDDIHPQKDTVRALHEACKSIMRRKDDVDERILEVINNQNTEHQNYHNTIKKLQKKREEVESRMRH